MAIALHNMFMFCQCAELCAAAHVAAEVGRIAGSHSAKSCSRALMPVMCTALDFLLPPPPTFSQNLLQCLSAFMPGICQLDKALSNSTSGYAACICCGLC